MTLLIGLIVGFIVGGFFPGPASAVKTKVLVWWENFTGSGGA